MSEKVEPLTAEEEALLRDWAAGIIGDDKRFSRELVAGLFATLDAERAAHRETQAMLAATNEDLRAQRDAEARIRALEEALEWYDTYDPEAVEAIRGRSASQKDTDHG